MFFYLDSDKCAKFHNMPKNVSTKIEFMADIMPK